MQSIHEGVPFSTNDLFWSLHGKNHMFLSLLRGKWCFTTTPEGGGLMPQTSTRLPLESLENHQKPRFFKVWPLGTPKTPKTPYFDHPGPSEHHKSLQQAPQDLILQPKGPPRYPFWSILPTKGPPRTSFGSPSTSNHHHDPRFWAQSCSFYGTNSGLPPSAHSQAHDTIRRTFTHVVAHVFSPRRV